MFALIVACVSFDPYYEPTQSMSLVIMSLAMLLIILQKHYLGNPSYFKRFDFLPKKEPRFFLTQRLSKLYKTYGDL
jgi:hypothetical protein